MICVCIQNANQWMIHMEVTHINPRNSVLGNLLFQLSIFSLVSFPHTIQNSRPTIYHHHRTQPYIAINQINYYLHLKPIRNPKIRISTKMCSERKVKYLCGCVGRRLGWERCEFFNNNEFVRSEYLGEVLQQWQDFMEWNGENCRNWEPKEVYAMRQHLCRHCQRRADESAGKGRTPWVDGSWR